MSMFWHPAFDPALEDAGDADDRAWNHMQEAEQARSNAVKEGGANG